MHDGGGGVELMGEFKGRAQCDVVLDARLDGLQRASPPAAVVKDPYLVDHEPRSGRIYRHQKRQLPGAPP